MLRSVRAKVAGFILRLALRLNGARPSGTVIFHGPWTAAAAGEWAAVAGYVMKEHMAEQPAVVLIPWASRPAFDARRETLVGRGPK